MFRKKNNHEKNSHHQVTEMRPLLFDVEIEAEEIDITCLHSDNESDTDSENQGEEWVATSICELSYELRVVDLLQGFVELPLCKPEIDALLTALPQGLIKDFFSQIALYYATKNQVERGEKELSEVPQILVNIQKKIELLFGQTSVAREREVIALKKYLLAYYYADFPVNEGKLVLNLLNNHDESLVQRRKEAKKHLKALMEKNFPLAFYAYTMFVVDEGQHFNYHQRGAQLLAPSSQAEFGQHYLTYLDKLWHSQGVKTNKHHQFDSVEKQINKEALDSLNQSVRVGNGLAINYVLTFLKKYCEIVKNLSEEEFEINDAKQNLLHHMSLVALHIRPDNEEIKKLLDKIALGSSMNKSPKTAEKILHYLNDQHHGYFAEMKINKDKVLALAALYSQEVNNIRRMQDVLLQVEGMLEDKWCDQTHGDYLNQLLSALDERFQLHVCYFAVKITERELDGIEQALRLIKSAMEEMVAANKVRNTGFLKYIQDEINNRERENNISSYPRSTITNLRQFNILMDLKEFELFCKEKDRIALSAPEIITQWKSSRQQNNQDNPFVRLSQLIVQHQVQGAGLFQVTSSIHPIYQAFIDYVDGDQALLLAWPKKIEEEQVNDPVCCCVLS